MINGKYAIALHYILMLPIKFAPKYLTYENNLI